MNSHMLVRVNDLQVDKSRGTLVHCIGRHQADTSGLWVLIRGRVTSLPAHPLLITPTSQINVMLFCCFSEISVDELTGLRNLFLLLTHNEKHHAIKMEIRILMHVSPWVVVLLSSLYDLISFSASICHSLISSFHCLFLQFLTSTGPWGPAEVPSLFKTHLDQASM